MGSAPIVVTGGTGTLGRAVVSEIERRGHRVRVLSRSPTPPSLPAGREWASADLLTGDSADVARAFAGAETVVHCATTLNGDRDVTVAQQVLAACAAAGVRHFVLVSIVGIDRIPLAYYRGKLEVERLVAASGVPATIQRATQFHDLVRALFAQLSRLPVLFVPDVNFQSVDVADVAARLADVACRGPQGRVADVGGPRVDCSLDMARAFVAASGLRRKIAPVRLPRFLQRGAVRAIADGGNLVDDGAPRGTTTFADYLSAHPAPAAREYRNA
ncbi:SDR family oxidoreductase [Zhihengliuella salsuginis]|uniref:Nucleotide-diphosphate-sugar epimerase n=1 Tax=Zhihengliuella salsuginis TaxID=578222 RepID=A0ABQ3GJ17_9MICC|nr:NAD(P)H-binding protein [Zhihengliuella salsuginis]GHD05002.1 nucleotide-diphosphate-sugar epimerase [Zhihengliuella salsuginis]